MIGAGAVERRGGMDGFELFETVLGFEQALLSVDPGLNAAERDDKFGQRHCGFGPAVETGETGIVCGAIRADLNCVAAMGDGVAVAPGRAGTAAGLLAFCAR